VSKENIDLLYDIIYDFLDQNNVMVIELAMLFKRIEIEQIEAYISKTYEDED
jgi:hypothetical protein